MFVLPLYNKRMYISKTAGDAILC